MRHLVLAIERHTTSLSLAVACLMLVVASSLGMFQIVARFLLALPAEWTEVLIRFSLVWMIFLAIPAAFRRGAMVSVDLMHRRSGPKGQRVLGAIAATSALLLMIVIIWWGWDYAVRGQVQTIAGLEEFSMFWAYLAMPVGGLFSVLAIVANALDPQHAELETAQ